MSVFAEFELSSDSFALTETLHALPEAVIEVERVVASEELLTPYFWVANVSADAFETATADDDSVRNVTQLDAFDESNLYRADWTENSESFVFAYTEVNAVILDAVGQNDTWTVQMRFDGHDQLREFRTYCAEQDIAFRVDRLHELSNSHTIRQYGLTEKQHEALMRTWEAGYFEVPAVATLAEIAEDLGISQQALSQRLRKGHNALIASTLVTESPT